MPTFESINFCRQLANRLVSISENGGDPISVQTPQALLSLNPQSLRLKNEDGTISTNPLHCRGFPELRQEVANKLVALSRAGQRRAMMETSMQQQQQSEEEDYHSTSTALHSPAMSIPGTVTALDMLKYQKQVTSSTSACLSTGSIALDRLVGIPEEMAMSLTSSISTTEWGIPMPIQGLPWGHVIQCTGPPAGGKTQLALQVAVSAASQGCPVLYFSSAQGHGCLRPLVSRLRTLTSAMSTTRHKLMAILELVSLQVVENGHQLLLCLAELEETLLSLGQDKNRPNVSQQQQQQQHQSITSQSGNSSVPVSHQPPVRVVILDSASGCLNTEDERLLQRIALRLKHLARHYHVVVWINNASWEPIPNKEQQNLGSYHHYQHHYRASTNKMDGAHDDSSAEKPLKPKVALGVAWQRVLDIHISLQIMPKPTRVSDYQQQPHGTSSPLIRANLASHPFKKCNDSSLVADLCITARGIQDYESSDQGS